jgi:peptidylprolyl isomerase
MRHSAKLCACAVALLLGCEPKSGASPVSDAGTAAPATASATASAAAASPKRVTGLHRAGYAAPEPAPAQVPAPPDVAKPPADATRTPSGLASKLHRPGTGEARPRRYDRVRVRYTGWKKDGQMFDSREAQVGVNEMIPGWSEAVQEMVVGEKRRIWVPAKLAYGDTPPPKLPGGDLTFDVELLEIVQRPQPPLDISAPPKNAKRTPSGLTYVVLTRSSSERRPKPNERVRVHYNGWRADGRLFDSTIVRGQPAVVGVSAGIPGFREGVRLMRTGDKVLFWIPGHLAYGNKPQHGLPTGMLVFEIELLEILDAGAEQRPRDAAADG